MSDPFAWDPNGTREAWFERAGPRHLKPITREGRRLMLTLSLGMATTIPLVLLLATAGAHMSVLLAVIFGGIFGVPAWFLWQAFGRIKV